MTTRPRHACPQVPFSLFEVMALVTLGAVVLAGGGCATSGSTTTVALQDQSASGDSLSRTLERSHLRELQREAKQARKAKAAATAAGKAKTASSASGESADAPTPPAAPQPPIIDNRISFDAERKQEMAQYSQLHYGQPTWKLQHPKVIVLHYTATPTWQAARSIFAANAPSLGEMPGVCSHYVIDQDGGIHEMVSPSIRCRHAIGLDYTAIGVEMVAEQDGTSHQTDQDILHRTKQISAAVQLVAWLQQRYGISVNNVIGHAMANQSPYFRDDEGWTNDHTDWEPEDVAQFRNLLLASGDDH